MARTGTVPTVNPRPSGSVLAADPLARVAALPGVREAADSARAAVDALLRHRILRRQSAAVTTEASLRAARASAALEGHEISLEGLRGYLSGAGTDARPTPASEGRLAPDPAAPNPAAPNPAAPDAAAPDAAAPDAAARTFPPAVGVPADLRSTDSLDLSSTDLPSPVVLGTVRLYAELGVLGPAWERAPRQALARMHVLVGRGYLPDDLLGRPRADAGTRELLDPLRLGPPPHSVETSVRLDGLTGLLVTPTTAPAVVVAAVVHGELLALRPFGALDGVIARAASRLVLISRGLDPKALTATDVGHLEVDHIDDPGAPVLGYRDAAAAYVGGGAQGVATWVLHCAKALELAARESLAVCEALARDT
ncbi:hypothetical protein [Frankia sp. ACN1ag]|uniref:hypothetical protein n=1 Tax=Frankia sp. ACN1ag TaxID=102891 RepID=UPI0006DC04FA|nr:hypothetical protein [Frankia sp. ACN1ag]KQC38390.1 hypothetical protein UK82_10105 [Frankia sp. ACN1ag]